MKMKAAVYYGPRDIRVEELERPEAGEEGIVIKIGACGICPLMDIPRYKNRLLDHAPKIVLGHEFCGDVIEIGSKVSSVNMGDKVYGLAYRPCGKCGACRSKDYIKCENFELGTAGTWINGGFAEYMRFPFATMENITILPKDMSHRDGSLIEPVSVGVGLASKAKAGDIVAIMGQELMGLATVAQLKKMGDIKIIVCDLSEKRLKKSREVGADIVVNENQDDPVSVIMAETSGRGADVVIETAGRETTFLKSIDAVKPHGDIWLGAFYDGPFLFNPSLQRPEKPHSNLTQKGGISMHCAWLTLPNRSIRRAQAVELIQSGEISADKHVTHFFPLDKITEAFEAAINPFDSIKVVVEP
ncbi:MAG: alcohol dehydrogenase catalytic domain-containing protein [Deltaproteobacteria bacterium]|nr:alcohol dehydrogenase catalytic domain-containing protein [Deltaproteobacteria bacterium]